MKKQLTRLTDENGLFENGIGFGEFNGMSVSNDRRVKSLYGPKWDGPRELRKKRGFYAKNGHLKDVGRYLLQGMPNCKVCELVGCSKGLVQRFRKHLIGLLGEIYCKCGLPSNHGTRCTEKWLNDKEINQKAKSRC